MGIRMSCNNNIEKHLIKIKEGLEHVNYKGYPEIDSRLSWSDVIEYILKEAICGR